MLIILLIDITKITTEQPLNKAMKDLWDSEEKHLSGRKQKSDVCRELYIFLQTKDLNLPKRNKNNNNENKNGPDKG